MTLLIFNNGVSSLASRKKVSNVNNTKAFSLDVEPNDEQIKIYSKASKSTNNTSTSSASSQSTNDITKAVDSLENRRLLHVKDIMSSPPVTVMPHELLVRVKAIMFEKKISQLVVVNKDKQPVGMIGTKELLNNDLPETSFIQNILDPKTYAVSEETLVRDVALHFMKYKTSIFAVINSNNQVVGIVSRSDLLKLLVSAPTHIKNV